MSDETTQFILGDAALDATGGPRKRRSRRQKKKNDLPPLTHCENCGAELTGEYCAKCGQHAIDYRRSLWRVMIDAADSFFNWDTKFLKSLGVLLIKPWKLTNDFNAGRRARYVHPLRLYLLGSIAFFLIARMVNLNSSDVIKFEPKDRAEMDAALAKLAAPDSGLNDAERTKVEEARAKLALHEGLPAAAEDQEKMQSALGTLIASSVKKNLKAKDHKRLETALKRVTEEGSKPPETKPGEPAIPEPPPVAIPSASPHENNGPGLHFGSDDKEPKNDFEKWMENRIKDKIGEGGTKAKLFLETLRSNVPTMMLFCIPLFAFVLKVLYLRQRRYYVEHLVYALHIHTFAYVSAVVITLICLGLAHWSNLARILVAVFLSCAAFVQVYLSIRRVYSQGWFFTSFKFLAGGLAYLIILITAVGITAFVTLLLPN